MVVCSFTDVTDRKAAEAQLHWLAYHDSLTGLGNRSLFNDELERELLVSMQRGTNLAVLFIDLDRFKLVNDSFGHASGDEVLLALAQRFKSAVRGGDVVSRFSGDEFVVLCRNVHDVDVAVSLATEYSRLLAEPGPAVDRPQRGGHLQRRASPSSCGAARSAQDILQQADVAMFQAKNKGRSRVEVFDESLRAKSVARLEIYDDLRHSIDHDELAVHYQPIASVERRPDRGHGGAGAVAPPVPGPARARWSSSPSPRRPTSSSRSAAGCSARRARPWPAGAGSCPAPRTPTSPSTSRPTS